MDSSSHPTAQQKTPIPVVIIAVRISAVLLGVPVIRVLIAVFSILIRQIVLLIPRGVTPAVVVVGEVTETLCRSGDLLSNRLQSARFWGYAQPPLCTDGDEIIGNMQK